MEETTSKTTRFARSTGSEALSEAKNVESFSREDGDVIVTTSPPLPALPADLVVVRGGPRNDSGTSK